MKSSPGRAASNTLGHDLVSYYTCFFCVFLFANEMNHTVSSHGQPTPFSLQLTNQTKSQRVTNQTKSQRKKKKKRRRSKPPISRSMREAEKRRALYKKNSKSEDASTAVAAASKREAASAAAAAAITPIPTATTGPSTIADATSSASATAASGLEVYVDDEEEDESLAKDTIDGGIIDMDDREGLLDWVDNLDVNEMDDLYSI